jgi:deoxyribodipyrimidine photo-lyase
MIHLSPVVVSLIYIRIYRIFHQHASNVPHGTNTACVVFDPSVRVHSTWLSLTSMRPIVFWFRRDLRVNDNAALHAAASTGAPIVPLFVFDDELIKRLPSDGVVFDFQAEALRELKTNLGHLGGRLIILHGRVQDVHKRIIQETSPAALYFNRDYEPYATGRDAEIAKLYQSYGIEVKTFKDHVLHEPDEVLTGDGRPYVVFTPFANAWKRLPEPSPFTTPSRLTTPDIKSGPILGAAELKKKTLIPSPAFHGGESQARKRWKSFLSHHIKEYQRGRDFPGIHGTSQMSPYLRFGCISVRTMIRDCRKLETEMKGDGNASVGKYIDELIWREFYQAVLFHFPRLLETNYRQEFDRMPWRFNEKFFDAWKEGRTGYPLVDAGMRELNQTGWMHNRVRMVVASFLTKDMMHDWRLGAQYFEEKLMDIETASNNGGWQWSASTGVDPRPLRIFNPRLQSERFDSDGVYIKKYVLELKDVPTRYIHAPHEMTPLEQIECGVEIGRDYPMPIVDHKMASAEYKQVFAGMKSSTRQLQRNKFEIK